MATAITKTCPICGRSFQTLDGMPAQNCTVCIRETGNIQSAPVAPPYVDPVTKKKK
jgi:hypothetical protein